MNKPRKRRRKSVSRKLTMQALQNRQLMAADIDFDPNSGMLNITGDDSDNTAVVRITDDAVRVRVNYQDSQGQTRTLRQEVGVDDVRSIVFDGLGQDDTMRVVRDNNDQDVGSDIRLVFYGGDGNDTFHNRTNLSSRVFGGDGIDDLQGGSGVDIIYGGERTGR